LKGLIVFAMAGAIVFPTCSVAQRVGAAGMGRGTGFSGNFGRAANRGGFGSSFEHRGFGRSRGFNDFGGYGGFGWDWDSYYGNYGYLANYGEEYPSPLNIVVLPPFREEPVEPPPPPPPPPRPEIHEYNWPSSGANPDAAFSIVLKDGTVHRAAAVWIQDNTVCFITPEGAGGQFLLTRVDREDTRRANAEQNLKLSLPAEMSKSTSAMR
jgi:hypothetical protein